MIDIENIMASFSIEEKREIAYFLSRYFKASPYIEAEGKDIFSDVFDKSVSDDIREATEGAIATIESKVGSAYEYDEETAQRVLDQITAYEDGLTDEPTATEKADAGAFFGGIKTRLPNV